MPTLSFQKPFPDLAFAKPKTLRLGAATFATPVWAKVLEEAARAMLDGARTRKAALAATKRFPWMGRTGRGMARPCELEPRVWIELHQGSHGILVRTKMLLDACGYPLDRTSLEYEGESNGEAEISHATSGKSAKSDQLASKIRPKSGADRPVERVGAYAKRMLTKALEEGLVPENDFFKLLDSKSGETGVFRLSGHPLFSRSMVTTDGNNRTYSEPIQTRFGFPVYLNSQWRDNHRMKLDALLAKWGVEDDAPVSPPQAFVQQTLPGLPEPKRSPRTGRKDKSKRKTGVSEKIGAYARRMLFQALAEKGRIPDEDFTALQSLEGTKALLGISLTTCPLFSLSPMIRRDGGRGSWIDPATHDGKPVYVNSQWYEEHREKLDRLLARWHLVDSVDRPRAVKHLSLRKESGMIPEIEKNLAELLEAEFPNGVRPGDFIDQRKLRKFYKAYFETELPADFPFAKVLPRLGIVHDGKVFPRPSEKGGGWRKVIDGLAAQGHHLFQYSRVMQRHAKELMRLGITSSEMLREVMAKSASDAYEVHDEYFTAKNVPPRNTIPSGAVLIDEKEVAKNLPYVEEDWIRNLFRNRPGLIWNAPGVWVFPDLIDFDEDETAVCLAECKAAVAKDGFFSLALLRLENSAAMNDSRIADGTLRRAFFRRFLSKDFDLAGQIVHAKGSVVDAAVPLRLFLRDRAETTLAEIEDLAREYNIFISKALETALEETVRVSRDRFVSPRLVAFDAAAADEAVAARCVGVATPLCEFAGFADFPAVPGFVWNDFLLESFLRRESRRFRLFSASSAAKDASGAVAEKAAPFADAPSAFAAAALAGSVDPDPEAVGDFLVASRCALRRGRELVAAVVSAMHSQKRNRK